jgi:hypothetical protein
MLKKIAIGLGIILVVIITTFIVITKYTFYFDDKESLIQKGVEITKKCEEEGIDLSTCAKELDKLKVKADELKRNGKWKN